MTRVLIAGWVVMTAGCEGHLGGGQGPGSSPTPPQKMGGAGGSGGGGSSAGGGSTAAGPFVSSSPFECTAGSPIDEAPLRRLSRVELLNAVHAVLTRATPTSAAAIEGAMAGELGALPSDALVPGPSDTHGGYTRLDQSIQQTSVDATYELALALGRQLTSSTARMTELMGACATDSTAANDATCLSGFVGRFGALVLRRPLTAAEVGFFSRPALTTPVQPVAIADVVALLVLAPGFGYQVEVGAGAGSPGRVALTAHELASRLSFHFWHAPPDAQLELSAVNGSLLTAQGYAAEVRRLASDARADLVFDEFFSQWLRLQELEPLDARVNDPLFRAFAGPDVPNGTLRAEVLAEVLTMANQVRSSGGPVSALVTNNDNFAASDALARLYGAPRWTGGAAQPLPPGRAGLLTRVAFLATGSANTRPVMKGFRLRSALMCDPIPPPPPEVNASVPSLSPDATTRETVEALTQQPGSSCSGCHSTLLNPLGFVTEGFDALGRARSEQRLFDASGGFVRSRPVRTDAVPRVVLDDERPVTDVTEVTARIVESKKVESCLSREYFRFTHRRAERASDGCALSELDALARSGAPLSEVMAAIALQPQFKERKAP